MHLKIKHVCLAATQCSPNVPHICSFWVIFIGPESDHWPCLSLTDSLTHWLTHSRLVNLIDVTLVCEDGNSKLVEVVTVVDVDEEDRVGNSLLLIWELRFGHKANFFRYCQLSTRVDQDFEFEVQARFWSWSLVNILQLMFCRGYEVESWSRFWS